MASTEEAPGHSVVVASRCIIGWEVWIPPNQGRAEHLFEMAEGKSRQVWWRDGEFLEHSGWEAGW